MARRLLDMTRGDLGRGLLERAINGGKLLLWLLDLSRVCDTKIQIRVLYGLILI